MTVTASAAVDPRSSARRTRSMPTSASGATAASAVVNTASFPTATPASLTPCSTPHIHEGRDPTKPMVRPAWPGISMYVARVTSSWRGACHSITCGSSGGRSLFLANTVTPLVVADGRAHRQSHMTPASRSAGQGVVVVPTGANVSATAPAWSGWSRVVTTRTHRPGRTAQSAPPAALTNRSTRTTTSASALPALTGEPGNSSHADVPPAPGADTAWTHWRTTSGEPGANPNPWRVTGCPGTRPVVGAPTTRRSRRFVNDEVPGSGPDSRVGRAPRGEGQRARRPGGRRRRVARRRADAADQEADPEPHQEQRGSNGDRGARRRPRPGSP